MVPAPQNRSDPIKPARKRTASLERITLLRPWSTTPRIRLILLFGSALGFGLGGSGWFGIFGSAGIGGCFGAGRARARLFFSRLFIAVAPIIGDIETGPFEDQPGAGADLFLHFAFPPTLHPAEFFGTGGQRFVDNRLNDLKFVFAFRA